MDHLTEQDAGLLEQAASMLEGLANDERDRGNCSAAEGAACSAHAIRRLAPALLRAGRGCLAQIEEPAAPAAVSPQGERQWICPTRTVADLVNNLLTMDQALPVYGAQYIEKDGRRCAIAVPPTVSRERVKDGRWIGQGEELNAAVVWTRAEQPVAAPGLTDGQLDDESYRVNDEPGFADAFRAGARFAERVHGVTASAVRAVTGKADWWRGRADEIEVRVARSGSQEAMRCYTDMRTLLQAAAPALEAPPHQCCNSWFASLPEGRQAVLRDDKWMLASAAYEAGRESCSALEAPAAPAGWKLVPVQDNPSMWTAGGEAIKSCGGHERDAASLAYKAMLAAAPQAPAAPSAVPYRYLWEQREMWDGGPGWGEKCTDYDPRLPENKKYHPCDFNDPTEVRNFTPVYAAAPAAPAVDAGTLRDAEHYRFIKRHRLILSGGTETFGWPIAPFGDECDRYISKELDSERAAQAAAKGEHDD